jgi:oligopeptide/dipeptide ABC transporter ATP-binding protein
MPQQAPLLEIAKLSVAARSQGRQIGIVDKVDLTLARDRTLAIVGESGSGKSMLALSIIRLLGNAKQCEISGSIRFDGQELLTLPESRMREFRGRNISMIFQDSLNALNPVLPVGRQIEEAISRTGSISREARHREMLRLLDEVKIPSPGRRALNYPHELSGGMRQRVMIAIALAPRPRLIIADEPTTSLDVTIQSQILSLLRDVRRENGMAMIFISHNLGAVAAIADDIAVMYAGQIVESGTAEEVLGAPRHPYARDLLLATPRIDRPAELKPIPGNIPRFDAMPPACRFAPRCTGRQAPCSERAPSPAEFRSPTGQQARCFFPAGGRHVSSP